MNIFNLDPETRVKILKGMVMLTATVSVVNGVLGQKLLKEYKNRGKIIKLQGDILRRFADLGDEDLLKQINDEFEFDMIALHIEIG